LLDNHVLKGVNKVGVVVTSFDAELEKDGLAWEELERKIANELDKAGIKTITVFIPGVAGNISEIDRSRANSIIKKFEADLEINELRVNIEMLKLEDSPQYIFHIQTFFATKVSLVNKPKHYIKTDVWKVLPVMVAVSVQDMPAKITDIVMEQVEAFIVAWQSANLAIEEPAKLNNVGIKDKSNTGKIAKSEKVEYKYVASKNSKVFHKAGCNSARRIKPENLTGYKSREEAINAGKRPCKRCNP